MEPTELLTSTVDKSQMPPLHQKRIIAFINHFLINSCSFLNEFANTCDVKFIELERKMQRLEVALSIIESKLASIPEDNTVTNPTNPTVLSADNSTERVQTENETETSSATDEVDTSAVNVTADEQGVRVCEDVRYKIYFKMVNFGVHPDAVKIKMQTEGFDPNLLDTPNLILPDGVKS